MNSNEALFPVCESFVIVISSVISITYVASSIPLLICLTALINSLSDETRNVFASESSIAFVCCFEQISHTKAHGVSSTISI